MHLKSLSRGMGCFLRAFSVLLTLIFAIDLGENCEFVVL